MRPSPQALGRWRENQAATYLEGRGYMFLERNFRTPYGEIDLVVCKQDTVVFVEVKTRSSDSYGMPEEAITPTKAAHLLDAVRFYIEDHPTMEYTWRIDVIAVQRHAGDRPPLITHFRNALA
jgi:putative endonuclease